MGSLSTPGRFPPVDVQALTAHLGLTSQLCTRSRPACHTACSMLSLIFLFFVLVWKVFQCRFLQALTES